MTLADPITEHRLIASLIVEPHVLAMADDLEIGDFADPRCQHVLPAIRRLQACEADIGLNEIDHEIQVADMERVRLSAGEMRPLVGFWFLVGLVALEFTPYRGERSLVEHDLAWLRELANRRRDLRSAA